ncbi:hypothetical protein TSMEX_010510 [Taenia solium]|eukprot:TsM_000996500 transcript=TsM_000996500 gene=TsM_000996500
MLCSAPILALTNFENDAPFFVLDTDASNVAMGGVLSQRDKEGREHVIAYVSIRFSEKLRQRSATERELFAIFTMVRHFEHYLIAKQFIVRTDHQVLTWLRTMEEIDRSELQQYHFTVQYRKGTTHSNEDALFRRPLSAGRGSGIQFQEAALKSNCTPATHAYGVLGRKGGVDIMGPPPLTKRGNSYILVMVDYFAKVAEAETKKSQDAETVASTFFNRWICQHGVPEKQTFY